MRIAVIAVAVLAGCRFDLPENLKECSESSGNCLCLLPESVCVECTPQEKTTCTGGTPVCGVDHTCRGCIADDECDSAVCLENGSCADAGNVIYAAVGGSGMSGCGQMLGQNECSFSQAVAEVQGSRNIVKLRPGTYIVTGQVLQKSMVLVARGSTMRSSGSPGQILLVSGGPAVTLIGGTISGAVAEDGVDCFNSTLRIYEATIVNSDQTGIDSESCELTVSRTLISFNRGGGIAMTGLPKQIDIKNNIINGNGQAGVDAGGMLLTPAGSSRLEFNTIVDNHSAQTAGSAGGVLCHATSVYNFPNNLVYRNAGGPGNQVQVAGECTFVGSFQQSDPTGMENVPMFVAPNASPPNYHLTAQSPPAIRDVVDCTGVDFDGERRPANGKCDLGADEYQER